MCFFDEVFLQGGFSRETTVRDRAEQFFFRNRLIFRRIFELAIVIVQFSLLEHVCSFRQNIRVFLFWASAACATTPLFPVIFRILSALATWQRLYSSWRSGSLLFRASRCLKAHASCSSSLSVGRNGSRVRLISSCFFGSHEDTPDTQRRHC